MKLPIEKIRKQIDEYSVKIYKLIGKPDCKAEEIIDVFWEDIEYCYGETLKYLKANFPKRTLPHIPVEDLLYDDKDEERIRAYLKDYQEKQNFVLNDKAMLFYHLDLILKAESEQTINNLQGKTFEYLEQKCRIDGNDIWVKIWSAGDSAECGEVATGDYYWRDAEENLCDHPGCDCFFLECWEKASDLPGLDIEENE